MCDVSCVMCCVLLVGMQFVFVRFVCLVILFVSLFAFLVLIQVVDFRCMCCIVLLFNFVKIKILFIFFSRYL